MPLTPRASEAIDADVDASSPEVSDLLRDFAEEIEILEKTHRTALQTIGRFQREKKDLADGISAVFNILDDVTADKDILGEAQRATINILEDFEQEKFAIGASTTAVFNILDDFAQDKNVLGEAQGAMLNILEDFDRENLSLQQSQTAMLNLLEDLDDERTKAAAAGAAMARAEAAETHAVELNQINEALIAANKELEGFSYSVSHDLRTPLRAIDGFSRILLEDYSDKLDAEGQRVLNVVRDSTVKMGRLIDDILSFSRIGRADMKTTAVDMEGLVREALEGALAPALAGRTLSIEIGRLPPVQADPTLIERVWTNLLDNAIKYTGPKPEARIEIGATPGAGETVYYVRDNGVGFDMQYVDKLFGVFQRLHGTEFPGTGIGLALVKRIVSRHHGRVWAEGKVDEGATFYFALPNEETADA